MSPRPNGFEKCGEHKVVYTAVRVFCAAVFPKRVQIFFFVRSGIAPLRTPIPLALFVLLAVIQKQAVVIFHIHSLCSVNLETAGICVRQGSVQRQRNGLSAGAGKHGRYNVSLRKIDIRQRVFRTFLFNRIFVQTA